MKRRLGMLLLAVALLGASSVTALAVPRTLQYQGRLTDPAGDPLTEPVDLTFSIYDAEDADAPLWSQTFEQMTLDNGRFSVLLGGDEAPFTPALEIVLRDGADLFVGIQIGDEEEMSPRQQIASVLYGLHAEYADTAGTVPGMPGISYGAVHREVVAPLSTLSVVTVTINTPAPGLILIAGSGTIVFDSRNGAGGLCHINVSETADTNPEADMGLVIAAVDSIASRAIHYVPFHSQRVYVKPAGTYVFHLNVRNLMSTGTLAANRPSLVATFFPNDYGSAAPDEGDPAAPARH